MAFQSVLMIANYLQKHVFLARRFSRAFMLFTRVAARLLHGCCTRAFREVGERQEEGARFSKLCPQKPYTVAC